MKTTLLTLMAVVALTASAAEVPFKFNTNRLRAITLPDGSWALVDKGGGGKPISKATPGDAASTAKWIDAISVAPVGALKTADLDGKSQWGTGLQIGYDLNPFVAVQVRALSFEGAGRETHWEKSKKGYNPVTTGEDEWGGRLVDELAILVPAKINRFSSESINLYVVPGAQWDLNTDNYGISAGLRIEKSFGKRFSIGLGYDVRAWFQKPTSVDSLASANLSLNL